MAEPSGVDMSTTQRKHRCGGTLHPREVQVVLDDGKGMTFAYVVPGLVCDKCGEELVERDTALEIERKAQIPTVVWRAPVSSRLHTRIFAGSNDHVAALAA